MNRTTAQALKRLTSRYDVAVEQVRTEPDNAAREWLTRALTDLSAEERLALALCYEEGLSCDEMGMVLGISAYEAERLHTRALTNLTATLRTMSNDGTI